jgi:polysaccharide deacetylase 2 family uncharacterized protein YibQ
MSYRASRRRRHSAAAALLVSPSVQALATLEKRSPFLALHMTTAKIKRLVDAAIQVARKNGASVVEVTIDNATVRIPLAPNKSIAEPEEVVL